MPEEILNVIAVVGPTAVGKTRVAIEIAKRLNGEIVSADSMQVYRRMDIGTAKASPSERHEVPHHMLDVAEPWENYSVARYTDDAKAAVKDIAFRGKLPIITGGTGLYVDSLLSGREFSEGPGNSGLRESLALEYDTLGGEKMLERLASVDPARAARLSANDKKRIVRALEIYALTGKTITEHDELSKLAPKPYRTFKVFLNSKDRGFLYDRIEKRVNRMFEAGLPDEVKSLLDEGVSPECTSMQAIGYKETVLAIRGDCSIDEAKASIKQGSRRYAKRQLTWFNRYTDAFRLDLGADPDLAEVAETVCGMFELLVLGTGR